MNQVAGWEYLTDTRHGPCIESGLHYSPVVYLMASTVHECGVIPAFTQHEYGIEAKQFVSSRTRDFANIIRFELGVMSKGACKKKNDLVSDCFTF